MTKKQSSKFKITWTIKGILTYVTEKSKWVLILHLKWDLPGLSFSYPLYSASLFAISPRCPGSHLGVPNSSGNFSKMFASIPDVISSKENTQDKLESLTVAAVYVLGIRSFHWSELELMSFSDTITVTRLQ